MGTDNRVKTTNVEDCLKAINDYIGMDEAPLEEKKGQLKDKAKKAMTHLSILLSPEVKNIYVDPCPSGGLPTID